MAKKEVDAKQDTHIARLRSEYDALKQRMNDYEQKFEDKVKEHPVASVSTAFAVGAVAGLLTGWLLNRK